MKSIDDLGILGSMDSHIAQVSRTKRVVRYENINIASSNPLLGEYSSFLFIKGTSVAGLFLQTPPHMALPHSNALPDRAALGLYVKLFA